MSHKEYKAVVFDMDGVIFDSEKATLNCWMQIAETHGYKGIENVYPHCMGVNKTIARQIFKKSMGDAFDYDSYVIEKNNLYKKLYGNGKLAKKSGVTELLTLLKSHGKKIALASSTQRDVVMRQLNDANLVNYFDVIVCGDIVERSKPDPDIYLKACKELNISPADAYAVEDSYPGIKSAYNAGLHPIMVPDLLPVTDEMEILAEIILPSLNEVIEYLK